jgi:hypothetical protein
VAGAHREVDGQHQDRCAHGFGPPHQLLGEGAVAHHIELEPGRHRGRLGNFLDRADRNSRFREGNAGLLRRPGGLHLGPRANIPARPTGPRIAGIEAFWPRISVACSRTDTSFITRCLQEDLREIGLVRLPGFFFVCAAVEVVEELARQASPGELTVVRTVAGWTFRVDPLRSAWAQLIACRPGVTQVTGGRISNRAPPRGLRTAH